MEWNRVYNRGHGYSAPVGWRPARHGLPDVPRLPRLPRDPQWCGERVRLLFQGQERDFFLAGSMAVALGVTRDSLLRLEARGVVPPAQFFVPGRWPGDKGKARCYPRGQVLRSRQWVEDAGLLGRRLSYRREEVRAALQLIADEEAAALRVALRAQSA